MGAAWLMWIALLGQTPGDAPGPGLPRLDAAPTASVSPAGALDDPLADLPLSEEDLALLEALDQPPEVEPALPRWPWRPADAFGSRVFEGVRLHETAARTTGAALQSLPALSGGWRWGAASPLVLDGLPVFAPRARAVWLRADPYLVDAVTLSLGADRGQLSEDLGGALRVTRGAATYGSGLALGAGVGLRSADRAIYGRGDARWGGERWAARLVVSGQQEDDLRVRREAGTSALTEGGPRADVAVSARARPLDGLEVLARFDYLFENGAAGLLGHRGHRGLSAGLSAHVGTSSLGLSLQGRRLEARLVGPDAAETSWMGRLVGHWRPWRPLELRAGGQVLLESTADLGVRVGERRRLEGHAAARFDLGRWHSQLTLRAARIATTNADDDQVASAFEVLPQVDLHVLLFGDPDSPASDVGEGLGLRIQGARGLRLEGPWALNQARLDGAARSWRLGAGPTLRTRGAWLDARAVLFTQSDDLEQAHLLGAELDGGLALFDGFFVSFALGWIEGAIDDASPAVFDPANLRGHLAVRYAVPTRGAYLELRMRAAGPRWVARSAPVEGDDDAFGFVRLGIAGGLDLGAGFRLEVTVENALDRKDRDLAENLAAPGLDLRAQLGWTL